MKKTLSIVIAGAIILGSIPSVGAADGAVSAKVKENGVFLDIKANSADTSYGIDWDNDCAAMDKGDYLVYKDLKLYSDIKSVTVKAAGYYGGHSDGDIYLFRLGSPKGEVIGECHIGDTDTMENKQEFSGSISIAQDGTYDLYICAMYGRHSAYAGVPYCTELESFKFSDKTVPKESESYVPATDLVDNYHDTWYAVDDEGRALADYEEVGAPRQDKYVAMFYWDWHESEGSISAPFNKWPMLKEHPEALTDYNSPLWPGGVMHFWSDPLFGYYKTTDRWVIRKHAQMLANAGVDVIFFDHTNGDYMFEKGFLAICDEFAKARQDGIKTPQIGFMTKFDTAEASTTAIIKLYKAFYQQEKYKDLWFMWEGKPLLLGNKAALDNTPFSDGYMTGIYNEIKNFFTFRSVNAVYSASSVNKDQWGWLETYPQHKYNEREDGSFEQMTVGIACNQSYATKILTAMNDKYAKGRSYTEKFGMNHSEGAEGKGEFFKEQFEYAIDQDPDLIFVTGWNEWIALRFESWQGVYNAFPDQYSPMYSRDIEPVKGEFGDNYYWQLTNYIRKFKGVRPVETASADKTIDINGSVSQWDDVKPEFINDKGMTMVRDYDGYKGTHYTNTTGRNDIVKSKIAKDADYMYFYVETTDKLTSHTDEKWMRLYINTDRDHATGWEGYDYIVNRTSPASKAVIEKNVNNTWEWQSAGDVDFSVNDNVLVVKIPRTLLGLQDKSVDIEFKWADNTTEDGNAIDFWVSGSAAPCGKFNYRYTEKVGERLQDSVISALTGKTVLKNNNPYAFIDGNKTVIYGGDKQVTPVEINGATYIPKELIEKILKDSQIIWNSQRNYLTVRTVAKTLRIYGDGSSRVDGVISKLNDGYKELNGTQYMRLDDLASVFGLTVKNYANNVISIGDGVISDTSASAVNSKLDEEVY